MFVGCRTYFTMNRLLWHRCGGVPDVISNKQSTSARNWPIYAGMPYLNFFLFMNFTPTLISRYYIHLYFFHFFWQYIHVSLLRSTPQLLNSHFILILHGATILDCSNNEIMGSKSNPRVLCCAVTYKYCDGLIPNTRNPKLILNHTWQRT